MNTYLQFFKNIFSGASNGFGMSLDLMVYVFIGFVIYFFLVVNEGTTLCLNQF